MNVIIRKLRFEDAAISWKWRNDDEVWRLAYKTWNNPITKEIEEEWIKAVLQRKNEIRFAICAGDDETYIGNVQLTDITQESAYFHIFIGNKNYWGQGIATKATMLVIDYARKQLNLQKIYSEIKKENISSTKMHQRTGFVIYGEREEYYLLVCDVK